MIEVNGWWLPNEKDHFVERSDKFLPKKGYQHPQRKISLKDLKNKRTAIDVGAHVGLWSKTLVKHFERVIAFEPVTEYIECLKKNVEDNNLEIIQAAVGESIGKCGLHFYENNTGKTYRINGDTVDLVTIDSFNFENIDYIKIDVEGFEYEVLIGAQSSIEKYHPRIVIEQKILEHTKEQDQYKASKLLNDWGYKEINRISHDHIFGWPKK